MSEIKRQDLIADDAIKAPLDLGKNFDVATLSLDNLIKSMVKYNDVIESAKSTTALSKATVELTDAQKELNKINDQITKTQAKNNDEYIAAKKALDDAKQSLKEKTALGDKDSKSVEAQTASIKQLGAALAANKKAYADLTGNQQRNTAQGQQLKKIIDEQDKSYKSLKSSIGENQEKVGAYREELEGLLVIQEGAEVGMEGLITKVRTMGKAFLTLLTNPIFAAFALLAVTVGAAKKAVETFFETTGEGELEAERLSASWDAFFFTMRKGFADIGKKFYEGVGGEGGIKGALYTFLTLFSTQLAATYAKASFEGDKFAVFTHELNEKLIQDIIDKAKAELDADILVLNSKDKLNFTDEQRLKFAKEAFAIRVKQSNIEKGLAEEQVESAFTQIGLAHGISAEQTKQLFNTGSLVLKEDERRTIAQSIANVYNKQNDILNQNKRLISEISTIEIEIDKRETEALRNRYETQRNLRLAEYEAQTLSNDNIIKDVQSTQEDITAAIINNAYLREATLAEINQKELDAARHAAEDRVKATGNYNAEEIAEIIKKDQILLNEQKTINTKYSQALKDEDKKLEVDLNQNVFTRLKKDYDNLSNDIKNKSNDQLNALEKTFLAGGKTFGDQDISSIEAYEKVKRNIIEESNRDVLIAQSKYLSDQISKLKLSKEQEIALYEAISKAEVDITSLDAERQIAIARKVRDAKMALINEVANVSKEQVQEQADAQIRVIDSQIQALQDKAQEETKLAGDNQRAKDQIALQEAKREKELQDKKVAIQRRAAIFEKALSLAQAGINLSQAATKALAEGGPILEGLVLALGAVQIAAIAAKPIPQYEKGTKSAIGGPSIVGEKGTEMVITPSGQIQFTPNSATLVNLQKGSEVITHEETMKILAMSAMGKTDHVSRGSSTDSELLKKVDILNTSIRSIKQPDLLRQGLQIYHAKREHDNFTKYIRGMNLGKWV